MRKPSNVLLVICSLIGSLLLLEFGLRVGIRLMPSSQPDPIQSEPHLYDAYRTHRLNPAFNTPTNTGGHRIHSADGFRRDTPVAQNKPTNTLRILVMGGSALYGIGAFAPYPPHRYLFNDETITAHLERMLNARLTAQRSPLRAEVINCGVIAYQTFQHLIYLNESLLKYHPDIVVNLDGNNDLYRNDREADHWGDYSYASKKLVEGANARDLITPVHLFFRWLSRYSVLGAQIEKRLTGPQFEKPQESAQAQRPPAPCSVQDPDFAECVEEIARQSYLRALWQINRLGQLEGYKHVVFLQPEIVLEDQQYLSQHDREVLSITQRNMAPQALAYMPKVREQFAAIFRKYGIAYHDVASLASRETMEEDLYLDYCHLTPAGARRVAERMLPGIWDMVRQRLPNASVETLAHSR